MMNHIESKEEALFKILTDMEYLGCFKYQTTNDERRKIVKDLISRIDDGTIDQLYENVTDWL
jgi:hypothetical protein